MSRKRKRAAAASREEIATASGAWRRATDQHPLRPQHDGLLLVGYECQCGTKFDLQTPRSDHLEHLRAVAVAFALDSR